MAFTGIPKINGKLDLKTEKEGLPETRVLKNQGFEKLGLRENGALSSRETSRNQGFEKPGPQETGASRNQSFDKPRLREIGSSSNGDLE